MERENRRPRRRAAPDTGLLYSVDDIARMAGVPRVTVIRLCLDGDMPEWLESEGRRYWGRAALAKAVRRARQAAPTQHAA